MTGKLTVSADGRIIGPANLHYNSPWPCANGRFGSGAITGVLMHTMVSELSSAVSWFNNPKSQASAHFGISESGEIWQFGPIGKGWVAWHAAEANDTWYGIEHADNGRPANPLTSAQIMASAQLVECLSAFAGFPLQISDSPSVKGYGWHGMGGEAFGGHFDCPGNTRKAQRPRIVALAKGIRSGGTPAPPAKAATVAQPREWTTAGQSSLAELAKAHNIQPATILRLTVQHGGPFQPGVAALVNGLCTGQADWRKPMAAGLKLWLPG